MAERVVLLCAGLLAFVIAASWAARGWRQVPAPDVAAVLPAPPPSGTSTADAAPAATTSPTTDVPASRDCPIARPQLSMSRQEELVLQMWFEIEVVKEEIRQEADWAEQHKYVLGGGLRQPVDEKLRLLRDEVDKSIPLITDRTLRARLQSDVVDALTRVQKSYAAKHPSR